MKKNYNDFFRSYFKIVALGLLLLLSSAGYSQTTKTVGATGADYATLKTAFDAINSGAITGSITLQLIDNTTETASAVLNASGTGSASYTAVKIYPTVSGKTISGTVDGAPLVDLNGADNVTIDGRLNQTGLLDLTISNASVVTTAGTSTIRFINDASSNTIKYAYIKGSTLDATGGVINFSTSTGSTGNDSNTIANNSITNAGGRPVNVIYSLGTSGAENDSNTISDNKIYDFLSAGLASNGIYLSTNTTAWTISGNSFYETASFSASAAVNYNIIYINNTGSGFTVSNNYIGGNAANCSGTWIKTSNNNSFVGMYIKVGTTTASNIQGNTIGNFDYTNSATGVFYGLQLSGGTLNVGTTSANIVGSIAGVDAIKYTSNNGFFNGFLIDAASGIIKIENNTVANITFPSTTAYTSINCIFKSATVSTVNIQNNTINKISSLYSGGSGFKVYGIQATGGNINTSNTYGIVGNTISNISSSCTTTTANSGYVAGIYSSVHAIIKNNIISGMTSWAKQTSTTEATAMGIIARANKDYIITGNTITNIKNDNSTLAATAVAVTGIFCTTSVATTNVISGNFISDLSVNASSTNASIYGIKVDQNTTTAASKLSIYNNVVSINGTTSSNLYGITDSSPNTPTANISGAYAKIYFNTVSISGTASADSRSCAYYAGPIVSASGLTIVYDRTINNNIFSNTRNNQTTTTSATVGHYAAYFAANTGTGTITSNLGLNYNDYVASGTGGVLGYYNAASVTSLPIVAGNDANSLSIDPQFENTGGTAAANYMVKATLTGVSGTGITTDYLGATRGASPTMGAWETYIKWIGGTNSNWSTAANWSSGTVPLSTSTINIPCGSNVVLDQDFTVQGALTVNGCATLTISPTKTLTIQGAADFGNQNVIFKSDATGTARLGNLTGTLVNATNVTVERYIPARRAFRFLSSPVTTSASIYANWQENGGSTSGLGTHITGSTTGANGFDATTSGNPSMYTHDNATATWSAVTNTNVNTLTAGVPYRLMVRGDRTISLTTNTPTPTATTLRATGTLFAGTKAITNLNANTDAYSLIGNPYQSPVDMQAVLAAATNLKAFYYIWDPTLGTRGAYVTRDVTSGTSSGGSLADNYLQPGQACFVQTNATGATSLSFTEANKYTATTNQSVFRLANNKKASASIRLTLFDSNALAAQGSAADGLVVVFGADNTNVVDAHDAGKLVNLDENLATKTEGKLLSIESRALPTATDEIQLYSDQYRSKEYTIVAEGTNMTGETPYLFDQFNNTYTEIPQTGKISYKYSVDNTNAASTASDRLKIVFTDKSTVTEKTQISTNEMYLYPNPSKGGEFTIVFSDSTQEVKMNIYNVLGQVIYNGIIGATASYNVNLNQSLPSGIYFVKLEQGGKTETKKLIIK